MEEKMSDKKGITRRQFLKDTSTAVIGSTLLLGMTDPVFSNETKTSTVVLVRNNEVLDENGSPRDQIVLEMLDSAVTRLTGKNDPVEAWKTFIKPEDIVGIKTNEWNYLPTTKQVEQALKKRVMDAGVAETNIGIQDRGVYKEPLFKKATALINARPMRSHHWSGVGSLIKNYITFVPDPYSYHGDSCADLAKLWGLPQVKGKTRLNVLVMMTPQFHGVGPHAFNPRYVWKYYGFLVGIDPVAVDATGVRIIQAKRKDYFGEDKPLNPPPKHIFLADTRHHLGNADSKKIDLIKIGYEKDILL
jgi:hypothetical protein